MLFKNRCLVVNVLWKLFCHEIDLETPIDGGKMVISLKNDWYPLFYAYWQYLVGIHLHQRMNCSLNFKSEYKVPSALCRIPLVLRLYGVDFRPESKPWDTKMQGLSRMEVYLIKSRPENRWAGYIAQFCHFLPWGILLIFSLVLFYQQWCATYILQHLPCPPSILHLKPPYFSSLVISSTFFFPLYNPNN